MTKEWQCPYCQQWRSVRYTGCTHANIPTEWDASRGKKVQILGAEPEIWTAERKPEYPTREAINQQQMDGSEK